MVAAVAVVAILGNLMPLEELAELAVAERAPALQERLTPRLQARPIQAAAAAAEASVGRAAQAVAASSSFVMFTHDRH
jgi:hypothetical protein